MEELVELTAYNFTDTIQVPDGYDLKTIPDLTRGNFQQLIDEHNKLVRAIKLMSNP